jgi:hypothetical protein
MNRRWAAALVVALTACTPVAQQAPQPAPVAPPVVPEPPPEQHWPPVDEVLLQRQALCAEPLPRRQQLIEQRRRDPRQEMRLELLMLASCAPPQPAALLPEALARVEELVGWPPAYRALFDLLASRALALTELERQRRQLQIDLDRTIRGISDIETSIDARDHRGRIKTDKTE